MPAKKRKYTPSQGPNKAARRDAVKSPASAFGTDGSTVSQVSKSKTEWRVERAQSWRELDPDDPDDDDLLVIPEDTEMGDSIMMSDALYVGWGRGAVVGDCIRTALYDVWYFTTEHTAPEAGYRMQQEVERMMESDDLTAKKHGELLKSLSKVAATSRAAEVATRQRLRGLGVISRDVRFDLHPGDCKQVVCPVKPGDLFFCAFGSQDSPIRVQATIVDTTSLASMDAILQSTLFEPSDIENNPPGFTSTHTTPGDVVIAFSLPADAQPCVLSVFVMRVPQRSIRSHNPAEGPRPPSTWVCAACGFSRAAPKHPVPGQLYKPLKCLMCDCAEATPRATAPPPRFDPPGVVGGPFQNLFKVKDVTGVLFTVNPLGTLFNRTANTHDGVLAADLYDKPLPPLPEVQ